MLLNKRVYSILGLLIIASVLMAACQPQVIEKEVVVTQVVREEVEVTMVAELDETAEPAPTQPVEPTTVPATPAEVDMPIEQVSLRYGMFPSSVYAPAFVALEKGYFSERGLDVEFVRAVGPEAATMVSTGQIDFTSMGFAGATFNAFNSGWDVIYLSSGAANNPTGESTNQLVVHKELYDQGTITSVEDLEGRKVAVFAPSGPLEYSLELALNSAGLTLKDIDETLVPLPDTLPALANASVDGALLPEPFVAMADSQGLIVRLSTMHDQGLELSDIAANTGFVEEHPVATTNFLIAWLMGARDLYGEGWEDPTNVRIVEKYTNLPGDVILQAVPLYFDPNGRINEQSVDGLQAWAMEKGYLDYTTRIPISQMIDYTYLEKAIEYLGKFEDQ